jgi:acetyl-CoA C-acetyltransferase
MILNERRKAISLGLKPLAFIKSYADAAQAKMVHNKSIKAILKLDKAGTI